LYRAYKLFFPREQSYSIVAVAGGWLSSPKCGRL
jgi:hypothetical protein